MRDLCQEGAACASMLGDPERPTAMVGVRALSLACDFLGSRMAQGKKRALCGVLPVRWQSEHRSRSRWLRQY